MGEKIIMIRPDMKVGDTFEDGNRTYRVVTVNEDGSYNSIAVAVESKPVSVAETTPETSEEVKPEVKRTRRKATK